MMANGRIDKEISNIGDFDNIKEYIHYYPHNNASRVIKDFKKV